MQWATVAKAFIRSEEQVPRNLVIIDSSKQTFLYSRHQPPFVVLQERSSPAEASVVTRTWINITYMYVLYVRQHLHSWIGFTRKVSRSFELERKRKSPFYLKKKKDSRKITWRFGLDKHQQSKCLAEVLALANLRWINLGLASPLSFQYSLFHSGQDSVP